MPIIGNAIARIGADVRPFGAGMSRAQRDFRAFGNSVRNGVRPIQAAIGVSVAAITYGLKQVSNTAMGYEASLQRISFMFEDNARFINNWASTTAASFGMSRAEATKYAAVYGNLLKTFTNDTEELTKYTIKLLESSAIVASATGRDMEDVMERMRSGLLGNTEAIEDLGISIFVNMIEGTKAFQQFANGKSWKQLDFQTQQQIRLFAILEQTTDKFGASLYDNTKTRLNFFTAQIKNAALNIGLGLLPMINAMLPALNQLAIFLEHVTWYFSEFMKALFGYELGSKTMQTNAKSAKQAAAAQTELGDAAEEAGKKASSGLQGFDELNVLQKNMGADTGGAGVGGPAAGGSDYLKSVLGDANFEDMAFTERIAEVGELVGKFKEMLQPLNEALSVFNDRIQPLKDFTYDVLVGFYDDVLVPFAGYVITELLPEFFKALGSALGLLGEFLLAVKPDLVWLWDKWLVPLAGWAAQTAIDNLKWIGDKLKIISDWIRNNQELVKNMTRIVALFIAAWKTIKFMAFLEMTGKVTTALGLLKAMTIGSLLAKLADAKATIYLTYLYAKDFVKSVIGAITAIVKQTYAYIYQKVTLIALRIQTVLMTAATWLYNAAVIVATSTTFWMITAIVAAIAAFIYLWQTNEKFRIIVTSVWNSLKLMFDAFFAGLFWLFGTLKIWLWDSLPLYFRKAKEGAIQAFASMGMKIVDIFNGVKKTVIDAINFVIKEFNKLLGGDLAQKANKLLPSSMQIKALQELKYTATTVDLFSNIANNPTDFTGQEAYIEGLKNALINPITYVADKFQEYSTQVPEAIDIAALKNKLGIGGMDTTVPTITQPLTDASLGRDDEKNSLFDNTMFGRLKSTQDSATGMGTEANKEVAINLDGEKLARLIMPYLKEEDKRLGSALAVGGA